MFFDDLIDDEQAQTHAVTHVLGGEERVEDPRQAFRRHARAAVADRDIDGIALDVAIGGKVVGLVMLFAYSRRHDDAAAAGNGIQRVLDQVEEHLLHALPVGIQIQVVGDLQRDRDLSGDIGLDEAQRLLHQLP